MMYTLGKHFEVCQSSLSTQNSRTLQLLAQREVKQFKNKYKKQDNLCSQNKSSEAVWTLKLRAPPHNLNR